MKRKEEKPMSKTTANVLIGVLVSGLCLGMVKGCLGVEKVKQDKSVPVMNVKTNGRVDR